MQKLWREKGGRLKKYFSPVFMEVIIFFIDIYKFLKIEEHSKKIDICKNMFLNRVCNSLYEIFLKMNEEINSKSSNFYVKSALEAFAVCIATSESIIKYKEVSGIEIFKNEVRSKILYASKHDIQNTWNTTIKPKLENLCRTY
jgi:hypothetical protein